MSKLTDQHYLRTNQYKDGRNLQTRIDIHQKFSTNPINYLDWAFNQLALPPEATILEVGCGTGLYWVHNHDRIRSGWHLTLSDFSEGMVNTARQNLPDLPATFRQIDVQDIPYPDATFDAVIANFMLYHVPDLSRALQEIRRVLKPTGALYAVTVGEGHMQQLWEAVKLHQPEFEPPLVRNWDEQTFTIETGAADLNQHFSDVQYVPYEDSLEVTDPEALADYVCHGNAWQAQFSTSEGRDALAATLADVIAENNGTFHIDKSIGMFIASGHEK